MEKRIKRLQYSLKIYSAGSRLKCRCVKVVYQTRSSRLLRITKANSMQIKYFGVNKRVAVDRKEYVGPSKKRELESIIEYKTTTKRVIADGRELDYLIKTIKDRFKSIGEVEVYPRLNMFDYEIMVIGKKKYLRQVFKDIL